MHYSTAMSVDTRIMQEEERGEHLPQRKPMPVGPHSLWAVPAMKSAPVALTSTGIAGTACDASNKTFAPTWKIGRCLFRSDAIKHKSEEFLAQSLSYIFSHQETSAFL